LVYPEMSGIKSNDLVMGYYVNWFLLGSKKIKNLQIYRINQFKDF